MSLLQLHTLALTSIHLPSIGYSAILPQLILLGTAVLLMAIRALSRQALSVRAWTTFTVLAGLASLGAALSNWFQIGSTGAHTTIASAIAVDRFSVVVEIIVSVALVLSALVGDSFLEREKIEGPEYYVLALISCSGAMFMGAANDLIVIFLGLEIMSIALYVLAGLDSRRRASGEAALKYFILGAFSSAIFLYGIALTYGATGSTNLGQIADYLSRNVTFGNGVLLAGLALLVVGFGFKIAAVPFHMWTPDVYQGSPTPVTGFMASVAKVGGFAALLRVLMTAMGPLRDDWRPIIWALAILSLVLGAVLALVQRNVKRMLAYSSINHAGFILLGVEAATSRGVSAALYYLLVYSVMVIGTFALVTIVGGRGDGRHELEDYRGLGKEAPLLAFGLTVLLVAQAGVPLTTGFLAKLYVITAAIGAHQYVLAAIAMGTAAVAAFFYLRLVVMMYVPAGASSQVAVEGVGSEQEGGIAGPTTMPQGSFEEAGLAAGPAAIADESQQEVFPEPWGSVTGIPGPSLVHLAGLATKQEVEELPKKEHEIANPLTGALIGAGLSLAITVVFGIYASPLVHLVRHAHLLFR
jgi:NADH-quinone oxidoreductase subunit N